MSSLIEDWLKREKYLVDIALKGSHAREKLSLQEYDLIILDWSLPEYSGLYICEEFRRNGGKTPILMLTIKKEIAEKEVGFEAGADDYLTKPFNLRELSARVKALLRRPRSFAKKLLCVGNIEVDRSTRQVLRAGERIDLTPKEYAILEILLLHPDATFSVQTLLERIWPSDSESSPATVHTLIKRLRKKLSVAGQPSIIQNVRSAGYKINLGDS
jgi:DNA-binding response OmpR family regulator